MYTDSFDPRQEMENFIDGLRSDLRDFIDKLLQDYDGDLYEVRNSSALCEFIHEYCDGLGWVIYTAQAWAMVFEYRNSVDGAEERYCDTRGDRFESLDTEMSLYAFCIAEATAEEVLDDYLTELEEMQSNGEKYYSTQVMDEDEDEE